MRNMLSLIALLSLPLAAQEAQPPAVSADALNQGRAQAQEVQATFDGVKLNEPFLASRKVRKNGVVIEQWVELVQTFRGSPYEEKTERNGNVIESYWRGPQYTEEYKVTKNLLIDNRNKFTKASKKKGAFLGLCIGALASTAIGIALAIPAVPFFFGIVFPMSGIGGLAGGIIGEHTGQFKPARVKQLKKVTLAQPVEQLKK